MESCTINRKWQQGALLALRILIGWHFLYEGLHKLIHPEWSALGFLANSQWIFSGVAEWIISNPGVLNIVDTMNTWGLIAIGLGLILGLFTKIASLAGCILLLLYYIFNPPFIGMELIGPMEGNYLLVNKTLIEAVTLFYIAVTPMSRRFGLDTLRLKYNA
jgi:thiosulfate dehydrogenase [quinone] large subunit